jgi:pimeloyl-ACP methyl ester carboxylesterase
MLPGISNADDSHSAIQSRLFSWHDATRNRTIPVKVFYPAGEAEKLPMIVFSHGLGGSVDTCSYLATTWVSKGFVAVFLQHPGSDENIWKGKIRIMKEFKESYARNWNGRMRAEDIRFVLDCLEHLAADNNSDNNSLASKLDLTRIGVGGYDLGCLASLLVAGQIPSDGGKSLKDSRVKAVLAMSPPICFIDKSFREVYDPIDIPMFLITGTEDDSIVGATKASQRRIPFDFATRNDRYLVVFQGGDHRIYGGRIFTLSARNDQPFQSAIVRASICFWQATLQNHQKALEILNGYGLNSMLGGMAKVERHLDNIEANIHLASPTEKTENLEKAERPESSEKMENSETTEKLIESTEKFPVSRYYRSVMQKNIGEL